MIIGFSYSARSQNSTKKTDFIMLYDKSEIEAIIIEISEDNIKYRKANNASGPLYSIKKSNVYMIVYSNGEREKFESVSPQNTDKPRTGVPPSLPTSNATIQNSSKQKSLANTANVETAAIETDSVGDVFDNGVGIADIGIDVTNQIGLPIPPIILNAYNNKFFKKISKYLFAGVNNSFIINEDYKFIGLSFGGRYYLNGLIKLDPKKFMVYGGASVFNTSWSSIQDNFDFNFGFTGRIGCTYTFSKRTGLFSEFAFADGGSTFMVGLSTRVSN